MLWFEDEISSTGSVGSALKGNLIPKVRSPMNESIEFVVEGAIRRRQLVGGSRLPMWLVFRHFFSLHFLVPPGEQLCLLTHTPAGAIVCFASDPEHWRCSALG